MSLSKKIILIALAAISFSLLIISASARRIRPSDKPALGIEIALKKPFYLPAATTNKEISAVVRVPSVEKSHGNETISAVKLVPRMEDGKVKVTVFALIGEAGTFKTCSEWDQLKSIEIGTYLASLDEEVTLSKLNDYGVKFENGPLKFRVVPRKAPFQQGFNGTEGCGCATCGRLDCCPYEAHCIGCGTCGEVCCR